MEENIIEHHYRITLTTHPNYPLNDEYFPIYCKFLPKYDVSEQFLNLYKDTLFSGIDLLYYYCCVYNNSQFLLRLIKLFNYTIPSFYSMYNPINYCIKYGLVDIFKIFYDHFKQYDLNFYFIDNTIKDCIKIGHYDMIKLLNDYYNYKYISTNYLYYYIISHNQCVNNYIKNYYTFTEIYNYISNNKLFFNQCITDNIQKLEFYIDYQYPLYINDNTLFLLYHNFINENYNTNEDDFKLLFFKKIFKYIFEQYSYNIHFILSLINNFINITLKYNQTYHNNQFISFMNIIIDNDTTQNHYIIHTLIKYCILYSKYYLLHQIYNSHHSNTINNNEINIYIFSDINSIQNIHINLITKYYHHCINQITDENCIIEDTPIEYNTIYIKCMYNHIISKKAYDEYLYIKQNVYEQCCLCNQKLQNQIYIQSN